MSDPCPHCGVDVNDLTAELDELRELLRTLVSGIDHWNNAVCKIIQRPVNYQWPALEMARAAIGMKCVNCESSDIVERTETETFPYGTPESVEIQVTQIVIHCNACGEEWTDYRGEAARSAVVEKYRRVFARHGS